MAEILLDPIGPLYLWTWIMVLVIVSLPLNLYLTRNWDHDA
jgi:hypothetical protein